MSCKYIQNSITLSSSMQLTIEQKHRVTTLAPTGSICRVQEAFEEKIPD